MCGMERMSVVPLRSLDLAFVPRSWPFSIERRAAIDAHFAARQREKPAIWNGRILVLHEFAIADGVFRGSYFETDYASFMSWREWGCPPAGAFDCCGSAAVMSGDGAFLFGVMGEHTANAGIVYLPGGTPDLTDIVGGAVDLEGSVRRELKEETGLDPAEFETESGWHTVLGGAIIEHVQIFRANEPAVDLRARALAALAREQQPELADIIIVRGPTDLHPAMPTFVQPFLQYWWR